MSGGGDGRFSYLSKECGNRIKVDPGDIGLSHIRTHKVAASTTNLRLNQQSVPSVQQQVSPSTSTSASINQSHQQQTPPPTNFISSPPQLIPSKQIPIKQRKAISTKIASIINQLKEFDKPSNLARKQDYLGNQLSYHNEASTLLYDISNSNSFLNENKHIFECSVLPQFKCKLCDDYISFDPDQQKLINNFEAHLKMHYSNSKEISPSMLTYLLYCLPSPFRNTTCLHISPNNGLLKCSTCNFNLPATAQVVCGHLASNKHNFQSKPAVNVPKESEFVKVCFQVDKQNGICLSCFSQINDSDINKHNHPTLEGKGLNETDVKEVLPLNIRSFGCFLIDQGKLLCNICNCELVVIPHIIYEHVLGENHNKKLYHTLLNKLSFEQYTKAKKLFVATSTNTVCCVFCGLEMQFSEIKFHLSNKPNCDKNQDIMSIMEQVPVKSLGKTRLSQKIGGNMKCELCYREIPSSAIHLHHHLLTPTHLNNVVKQEINSLNNEVKQVEFVAQFCQNEVLCLICKKKLHPTEIVSHKHLLGNVSSVKKNHAIIDCFANTLKSMRCLIQTDDHKVFCSICNCHVPCAIGNFLEHILGENHNQSLYNQFGTSLNEITNMERFIHCDKNELLCLDCNVKFPIDRVTILNHQKQSHSSKSETLQKLKDIPCLVPSSSSVPNSLFCTICNCSVPWSVKNVLEHLLGKPHNKKILNNSETSNCFIQVKKNTVVCLNCNHFMYALPSTLNKHISIFHRDVTPDFSNIISYQLKSNKCLIKTVDDKITCIICQCTIPTESKNMHTHFSATNTLTNLSSNASSVNSTGKPASNQQILSSTDRTIDCFLDVLKHTRCLILTNDNRAVCSICSCDVPLTIPKLLEHVLGENHNKNILTRLGKKSLGFDNKSQLQNFILCDKNVLLCLDCNTKFPLGSDVVLNHKKQSHSTLSDTLNKFKDIPCLAPCEQNSLFCFICNCMVPWSVRNILEHLLGRIHNNKISNGTSTANKSSYFVQVNGEEVLCLNCNCKMSASIKVLNTHISEYHNNNGVLNFPRVISQQFQNNQYLIKTVDNQVTCLLCHCTFPADMESVKNHLSEATHINNLSFDASTFLSHEFAGVKCFLKTDVAQVMCLVCNCFVPLSSVNLSEHLLGRRHNKLALQR